METLKPARELAGTNPIRQPNESAEYREARQRLLIEEIELRRRIHDVSRQRRELPPGGEVTKSYLFHGENGPVKFAELFGLHDSLIVYKYMYGPERAEVCPMCTSFMKTFEYKIEDIRQNCAIAFVARSPIERLVAKKREFGWKHLPVYEDPTGEYARDYVHPDDLDYPGLAVFKRWPDGKIRHFWSAEGSADTADPGQDPHNAPDPDGLWVLLDLSPNGRKPDWYPKLHY